MKQNGEIMGWQRPRGSAGVAIRVVRHNGVDSETMLVGHGVTLQDTWGSARGGWVVAGRPWVSGTGLDLTHKAGKSLQLLFQFLDMSHSQTPSPLPEGKTWRKHPRPCRVFLVASPCREVQPFARTQCYARGGGGCQDILSSQCNTTCWPRQGLARQAQ